MIRIWLYIVFGVSSSCLGWSFAQFIISDFGYFESFPEVVLFPFIAISLGIGMIAADIFINNPTHLKRNIIIGKKSFLITFVLGLLVGLIAAGFIKILLFSPIQELLSRVRFLKESTRLIRIFGWVLIGTSVGLTEGLTWRFRSIEAGDKVRFYKRFFLSLCLCFVVSFLCALFFEQVRDYLGIFPPSTSHLGRSYWSFNVRFVLRSCIIFIFFP